jgi:SAM-dependent methyltransferase
VSRVAAALRRHGPAGLPRAAALRAVASARHRLELARERAFDRRRRIDTAGVIHLNTTGTTTNYQPVHPKAFRDFLRHVPGDRGGMTFLDYGSGRGRALFLAVEHGFAAAVGVELEPAHHRVAEANRARYRGRREAIGMRLGDARDLPVPAGPLVVFVYNPFPRDVLVAVLENVRASLATDPRPAWLIYEAPIDRDVLDADPLFELIAERTERAGASPRRPRFAIYRARPTPPCR